MKQQIDISSILKNAKNHIRLLGVVGLDVDWDEIATEWASKFKMNSNFQIEILCESDNMLFGKSFISDTSYARTRISYTELKFKRDLALELPDILSKIGMTKDILKQVTVEVIHLWLPATIIDVDGKFYASLWLDEPSCDFQEISKSHTWSLPIQEFINSYFAPDKGRKYACKYGEELLELFDHKRIPRGIYPRKSFYDTDFAQLVVWAFIFDRRGKLLIHRRASNAKDNRDMWDKSVGGHVDFGMDIDSSRSVLREVVEELYEDETQQGDNLRAWVVSDEDMIYFGDWRPNKRKRHPFLEMNSFKKEWAFFRLPDHQVEYSPRTLPDGKVRRLRIIADVFAFVAGPQLDEKELDRLENSDFKLIEISQLKSVMDKALAGSEVPDFDKYLKVPKFTPDLTNVMTSGLRDALEEFAQYIKKYVH